MPARRRMLVALTVLLAALALGAALQAPGERDERTATRPAPQATAPSPPSRTIVASLSADAPEPATAPVRARVGDVVKLVILSRTAGTVTLDGYDRIEPTGPQSPARFSFIAQRAGSFPVRVRRSGAGMAGAREGPQVRLIAKLVVEERQTRG